MFLTNSPESTVLHMLKTHFLWLQDKPGQRQFVAIDLPGHLREADFADCVLREADLSNSICDAATFAGADLSGADLTNCRAAGANFTDADLSGAIVAGADFRFAVFTGADLTDVDMTTAHTEGAIF